jgi:hypothetical protein
MWVTFMSKTKRAKQWPPIYKQKNRSGQHSYVVDLGKVEGSRKRQSFPTKEEASTYAEQARILRANEGMTALTLPQDIRLDAAKANLILAPHEVSILEAAKYYEKHVLAYKSAPVIKDIVEKYHADSVIAACRSVTRHEFSD